MTPLTALYLVKNEETVLNYSLESVVPFVDETVIINNLSTDRTAQICEEWVEKYPGRVRFIEDDTDFDHTYEFENRNKALQHIGTEFFAMLDADQVLSDGWREAIEPHLKHPKCEGIYVKYEHCVGDLFHIQKNFLERQLGTNPDPNIPLRQMTFFRKTPTLKCWAAAHTCPEFRLEHHSRFDEDVPQNRIEYCDSVKLTHLGFCRPDMMRISVYRAGRGDHGHAPEQKASAVKQLTDSGNPFLFCAPVAHVAYGVEGLPTCLRGMADQYRLVLDEQGYIKDRIVVATGLRG